MDERETRRGDGEKSAGLMSCSKSTLCSWEEESRWPMFVQMVYFWRPRLLRKACSSGLHPYKHANILQRDQGCICMRMRSPGGDVLARQRPRWSGGLCSSTCSPRGLTGLAPRSRLAGSTSTVPRPALARPPALAPQPRLIPLPSQPPGHRPAALAAPCLPN